MTVRRFVAAAALVASCAIGPAAADDADPPVDCNNAMSTVEMNFCAEKDLQASDGKLNDAYGKALAFAAKNGGDKPYDAESWQEALRVSQRAWIAFRDADCKGVVPMSWAGGTGTTVQVLGCMKEKTDVRTKELRDMYETGN